MLRTTPNSLKDTGPKPSLQDYKKQQSQPIVSIPENNNFFHIPQKYQQSRAKLSFKPQTTTSKSIEEKRYKVNKNNFSENNNRTNSSSKSRLVQIDDDSMYSSQNALKLKKIIGDPSILNTQILKQLSRQNLTCDSQSPGIRQNKSSYKKSTELDQSQLSLLKEKTLLHKKTQSLSINKQKELIDSLWNLDRNVQASLAEQQKKQYYLKSRGLWDQFKDGFAKYFAKIPLTHKSQFNSLSIQVKEIEQQWAEIIVSISNNIFDLLQNAAILMACEQDAKLSELIEQMRRERDIWQNNCKQVEQERDILLETVQQLKETVDSMQPLHSKTNNKEIDTMDTIQLKEMSSIMQQKIQEMSDKEAKLIKLVLAIRRSGVDIEKIYNEEVLNDDSVSESRMPSSMKKTSSIVTPYERSVNDADNSVINDSDESSFCYKGRLDNESIIESIRRFENRNVNFLQDNKNTVKLKLDLSKCTLNQQKQLIIIVVIIIIITITITIIITIAIIKISQIKNT